MESRRKSIDALITNSEQSNTTRREITHTSPAKPKELFMNVIENYQYLTYDEQGNKYLNFSKALNNVKEAQATTSLADQYMIGFLGHLEKDTNFQTTIETMAKNVQERKNSIAAKLDFGDTVFRVCTNWFGNYLETNAYPSVKKYDATILSLEENMDSEKSFIKKSHNFNEIEQHAQNYTKHVDALIQLQNNALQEIDHMWYTEMQDKKNEIYQLFHNIKHPLEHLSAYTKFYGSQEYTEGVTFEDAIDKYNEDYKSLYQDMNPKKAFLLYETTDEVDAKADILASVNKAIDNLTEFEQKVNNIYQAVSQAKW